MVRPLRQPRFVTRVAASTSSTRSFRKPMSPPLRARSALADDRLVDAGLFVDVDQHVRGRAAPRGDVVGEMRIVGQHVELVAAGGGLDRARQVDERPRAALAARIDGSSRHAVSVAQVSGRAASVRATLSNSVSVSVIALAFALAIYVSRRARKRTSA